MNQEVARQAENLLLTVHEYLSRLIPGIRDFADRLYGDERNIPWDRFTAVLEGMEWLFEAHRSLENSGYDADGYHTATEKFAALESHLAALSEAFQNKDFTMMGDLLNYEICPNLEEIRQLIAPAGA